MIIFPTIHLACLDCWTLFVSSCGRSLMLQPWKTELIYMLSYGRESPLSLGGVDKNDRFFEMWSYWIEFPGVIPVKAWERLWEVREVIFCQARALCLFTFECLLQVRRYPSLLLVDILWSRSEVFLKVWILRVWGFLFWLLTLIREMISTEFDTFWNGIAKLSFMTAVVTPVALEWATLSSTVC
jgi:hypothetical protein